MKSLRIALAVMNCPVGHFESNLQKTLRWTAEARRRGADMICFPELNLTGYAVGEEIRSAARPLDAVFGPLRDCARQEAVTVLAGLAEADPRGPLYATHLIVSPAGDTVAYRKLYIAPPEQGLFSPGHHVPLPTIDGAAIGIQLCYDAHFPELSTRMALDGAELLCMPHASPRGTPADKLASWMRHLPARAFDNGVFVAVCNQTGDNGAGLSFPGTAMVLGPDGAQRSTYTKNAEGLLVVDLDAEELRRVREHRMRYFLPNRRTDIDRLPGGSERSRQ